MSINDWVKLIEVSPRDGLQSEAISLSIADRIMLIEQLANCGLQYIEAGSFVSPEWIPQLIHSDQVFQGLTKRAQVCYSALVPNMTGLQSAIAAKADAIAIFMATTDSFTQKNLNCTIQESLVNYQAVIEVAKAHQLPVRGYLSCIFHCPYEGLVPPWQVATLCQTLLELGCTEISLGDTTGVGTILQTKTLLSQLCSIMPATQLAVHFHDTYGQALPNILVALDYGIRSIDCSVAGLGGCPYAQGATGNVATEDVVYMLQGMGLKTSVDLPKLIAVGQMISQKLRRDNQSKLGKIKTVNQ